MHMYVSTQRHTQERRGVCDVSCLLLMAVIDAVEKKIVQRGCVQRLLGCPQHARKSNYIQELGFH